MKSEAPASFDKFLCLSDNSKYSKLFFASLTFAEATVFDDFPSILPAGSVTAWSFSPTIPDDFEILPQMQVLNILDLQPITRDWDIAYKQGLRSVILTIDGQIEIVHFAKVCFIEYLSLRYTDIKGTDSSFSKH